MPAIDLTQIVRAKGTRRKSITFRPIATTNAQATDLAQIYAPAWQMWAEAKESILRGYVLPTQDGLTQDSANDIQSAIDRAAEELSRIVLAITPALRRWTVRIETWHRGKWAAGVKTATGVSLGTVLTALPVQETMEVFVARNVALVRDVSQQTQGRIADIVFRSYQQRKPIAQVAKELDEAIDLGRKRSRRIAQDQTVKIAAALDRERQTEAGIEKFEWRHGAPANPRPDHVERDGRIYSWKDPPAELPGELPNCTCRAAAYLDIMAEIE